MTRPAQTDTPRPDAGPGLNPESLDAQVTCSIVTGDFPAPVPRNPHVPTSIDVAKFWDRREECKAARPSASGGATP